MQVEKWSCMKMKRARKNRTEVILFKRLLGQIPEKYLLAEKV